MILKYTKKVKLLSIVIGLFSTSINAQVFDNLRFGGGIGSSYYWGSQSDNIPKLDTYGKNELNTGFNFQIYKAVDYKNEFGIRYLKTQLWSFKSNNTQAINVDLNEFAFVYQRSLNDNVGISSSPITFNMLFGIGIIRYSAMAYSISPKQEFNVSSSVGNGYQPVPIDWLIRDKQTTAAGLVGFNMGVRVARILTLYFENTFTLSASNNITGVLTYKGKLPVNGYTYHALSLYFNLGNQRGKLGCPKF
ncbi:MAG: hypothetical protein ACOYMA_08005 [Bacteroidia bacterium]